MTGHEVHGPDPGEPPTLEMRWIRPGELDARTLEWFERFPAAAESRDDDYLINPNLTGLSVKIRRGHALEVKAFRGRRGVPSLAGHLEGFVESWQRWSFPAGSVIRGAVDSASWRSVHKVRHISFFAINEGRPSASIPTPERGTGCAVELTEVTLHGRNWWDPWVGSGGPARCASRPSRAHGRAAIWPAADGRPATLFGLFQLLSRVATGPDSEGPIAGRGTMITRTAASRKNLERHREVIRAGRQRSRLTIPEALAGAKNELSHLARQSHLHARPGWPCTWRAAVQRLPLRSAKDSTIMSALCRDRWCQRWFWARGQRRSTACTLFVLPS
jgi:hypothetical protein